MHTFAVDGGKFVYDADRMMILEVDNATWDYCIAERGPTPSPRDEIARVYGADAAEAVVVGLREAGLIVPSDTPPATPSPPSLTGFSGLWLNITHGCNLKCTYCFAKQGNYGLGDSLMSEDTARKAVDWLSEHSGDENSATIDFFGGEPLMNMRAIVGTMEYANQRFAALGKDVFYHITTNGTLLNERNVKTLAEARNLEVQVSLDGVAEINDQFRVFASGRGSYDIIAKGIKRLKSAMGKIVLRGTILPGSPEFGASLRHFIEDLGGTTVAFEPMCGATLDGKMLDQRDINAIKAEWGKVTEYFIKQVEAGEIKPVSQLFRILLQLHKRKKSVYGCAAGLTFVAVEPGGDIYPCHTFVGQAEWKMGNIHLGILDESMRRRFVENTVDNREPCKSCWARYICGGSCVHEAKEVTGKISDPDPVRCDLMRHIADLALKTYVRTEPYHKKLIEKYGGDLA